MSDRRPRSHTERAQVIRALRRPADQPPLPTAVVTLVERLLSGPMETYERTLADHEIAEATEREASDAAEDADDVFDAALRRWAGTVRDVDGKTVPRELAPLLGDVRPGDLVGLPYEEEVTRTRSLLRALPSRPTLAGGDAERAALVAAVEALDARATAEAEAHRRRLGAGVTLVGATRAFDTAYGKVRRASRAVLDEATFKAIFPAFPRRSGSDPT